MRAILTKGIVLARTNFQEADRIITVLTPDQGKLRLMAKGVRRPKSKLAGGIELFSVGELSYLPGRKELGTLVSSRLEQHYGDIVQDINRTMFGYDVLKRFNKITEEVVEADYFHLLVAILEGLNQLDIPLEVVEMWAGLQLLKLTGQAPNLETDVAGQKLSADQAYDFSFDDMSFVAREGSAFTAPLIKVLRLALLTDLPALMRVQGIDAQAVAGAPLVRTMLKFTLQE